MTKRYRNGWWLEEKYHEEGCTQQAIAELCNVSPRTIRRYMTKFDIETRDPVGEDHPHFGTARDPQTRAAISDTLTGRSLDEESRRKISTSLTGNSIPPAVRAKIAESLRGRSKSRATRRKMSDATAGESNPNWQGGYSGYYGPRWSLAREIALERDRVCRGCGHDGSNNRLEVHHIIPVRLFRESEDVTMQAAHDPSNLVVLCNRCHTSADFGGLSFSSGLDPPD